MAETSEARKRREFAAAKDPLWCEEKARLREAVACRDATKDALAEIYSGAGYLEADGFLDHLGDLGYRVVEQ